MEALAALERVCKRYGHREILRGVSASFCAGSITLVCGSNGAGKSTLLRLVAGLARPTSGKVARAENSGIGYLGHATFLYPALTALENLEFWAKAHRASAAPARLMEFLEKMNLGRHAHEPARIFSRGMAQRLSFARILAQDADLLLLDEPFSALDAQSQTLMRGEILAKRAAGAAIAMVSHALAADMDMADNVLAIKNGRLAYAGPSAGYAPAGRG